MTGTVEVIREARNLLFERGWWKGDLEGPNGELCVEGALCVAKNGGMHGMITHELLGPVWKAIEAASRARGISSKGDIPCGAFIWNDAKDRTFDEVIEVLDRAEKIAEQSELAGERS